MKDDNSIAAILAEGLRVANIGVADFADSLAVQGAAVVQVEWTPPPELDDDLAQLLEELG
jgi:hypothetical protein